MTNRFLYLMATAAFGAGMACAGEEYMPLAPGPDVRAFAEIGPGTSASTMRRVSSIDPDGGERRPRMQRNTVKLTLPSAPARQPSRLHLVEAMENGVDGTLTFQPTETLPGTRHADIPGLVPPEVLALNHLQQAGAGGGRQAFPALVTLPHTLGTEELREFDPAAVSQTGDPFRDTPGFAEAFPAAATHSQPLGLRIAHPGVNRTGDERPSFSLPEGVDRFTGRATVPGPREFPASAPPLPVAFPQPLEPLASTSAPQPIQLPAPLGTPASADSSRLFVLPGLSDAAEPAESPNPFVAPEPLEASLSVFADGDVSDAADFAAPVRLTESEAVPPALSRPRLEPPETAPDLNPAERMDIPSPAAPVATPRPSGAKPPALAYSPPPPAPLPELPMPKVSSPLPRPVERPLRAESPRTEQSLALPAHSLPASPQSARLGVGSTASLLPTLNEVRPGLGVSDTTRPHPLRPPPLGEFEPPPLPLTHSAGGGPPSGGLSLSPAPALAVETQASVTGARRKEASRHDSTTGTRNKPPSLSESVAVGETNEFTPMRGLKIY